MADVREMRIFSADQIEVPTDLPSILKDFSKEVIRNNPQDLVKFSRQYFEQMREQYKSQKNAEALSGARVAADPVYPRDERNQMFLDMVNDFWDDFDSNGSGKLERAESMEFVKRALGAVCLEDVYDEQVYDQVIRMIDGNGDGSITRQEMANFLIRFTDEVAP